MKKTFLLSALLAIATIASAQYRVLENGFSNIKIKFTAPQPAISTTTLFGEQYTVLAMEGFGKQAKEGQPSLPSLVTTAEIALCDGLTYSIESMVCDTLDASTLGIDRQIAPTQPSLSKSAPDPTSIVIDKKAYGSDAFLGAPAIELQKIGIARNRNLAHIVFNPVRWNPVQNQVIIIKEITINVKQNNADTDATLRMKRLHSTPAFGDGIKTINSLGPKEVSSAPIRYTIVAHSSFRGALDDFAAWKRRKGFIVDLVYTDDTNVGSTTSSIKNYLRGLYNNATPEMPAPTYVLFVGDVNQIPAYTRTFSYSSHRSDLEYCCWTGDDNLPDCYYGRFSAQTLEQLEPQISKTLMYEQYTFPDPTYLANAALIAGVDRGVTTDNAYTYGDPAMDYVAKTYVTSANGFNNIVYYKNNTSFAPSGVTVTGSSQASGTAAALRNYYNSGCGFVNYTAHGSETSWGDPSFTNSHVAQMTNNNKPMFMIGNCCLTNSYQIDACFGEALLRKDNNAGAVIYIGASNSTYWSEDFYWSVGVRSTINNTCNPNYDASNLGMYDRLYHSHGEAYSDRFTTAGSMIYAGNWAVEGSTTNESMKTYYWEIYHVMGDPSLMPYYKGEALTMTVQAPTSAIIGTTSINVTAVPYAYIALKDENNNLIAANFADATGNAQLTFNQLSSVGNYELSATAQGYQPFFQTINVHAAGPYVSVMDLTTNNTIQSNSRIDFSMGIKNIGINTANNITVELQCLDGSILFDTTGQIALNQSMIPEDELQINNIISGYVWPNVKDQTETTIKVIIRWGNTINDQSVTSFRFTVNSDNLKVDNYSLDNVESCTADLHVSYKNKGHIALDSAEITLISLDPSLSILQPTSNVSDIDINELFNIDYELSASTALPTDRKVPFLVIIDKGYYTYNDTLYVQFGVDRSLITFEDGTIDNIITQNNYPWEITNQNVYNGTYCIRSRAWASGEGSYGKSEMTITLTSVKDDSITFYKNVSSEEDYDFFRFYIDGQSVESISGTSNSWSRSAHFVPEGTHTFKFSYEKDGSVNRGSDCAWIDDLKLPQTGYLDIYIIDSLCQGDTYSYMDSIINTEDMSAGIYQRSDTVGTTVKYLTLFINERPEVSISASADTIRAGESIRLTATGANNYLWSSGESNPIIDVYPTETTTYSVTGYNGSCSSTASYTIVVDGTIGINTANGNNTYKVYPNPVYDIINIEGPAAKITITDINGRHITTQAASTGKTSIDVNSLPVGIYIVQIVDNEGIKTAVKFIKK